MSKTKEQIMEDEYKKLVMNWEKAYQQSPSIFKAAHSAMDEHEKNQAIDFAEWISRLGLFQGITLEWYDRYDKKVAETTIELYAIFLQSQSQ